MGKKEKVLLVKPLAGKGNAGDIVDVKTHYANYVLLPQGIAVRYDKQAKNQHESHQKRAIAFKATMKKSVQEMIEKLEKDGITFTKEATEANTLYDSVSNRTLSQYAKDQFGLTLSTECFGLEEKISELGEFTSGFTYEDIKGNFTINVVRKTVE